jgi:lipid II:glycine glycyltransferase (peptidoglycan interpeptide bridge formation enzyme)
VFGATKPEMRHSGAATKLMFENIYRAKESGIQELDFVGVNSPQRGDFKLSFNAELKLYFDVRFYRTMNL